MDTQELKITADLAQLELGAEEMERLNTEVQKMIVFFESMKDYPFSEAPSEVHDKAQQGLRGDAPAQTVEPDELLEQSPDLEDRFFAIPNVL